MNYFMNVVNYKSFRVKYYDSYNILLRLQLLTAILEIAEIVHISHLKVKPVTWSRPIP